MDPITITLGITTAGFALTTMVAMVRGSKWADLADLWQSSAKYDCALANKATALLADTERNLFLATEGRERTRAHLAEAEGELAATRAELHTALDRLAKHESRRAKDNAARKARHQRAKVAA